jgi:hypothetical protein
VSRSSRGSRRRARSAGALFVLLLLLPFEPREPSLAVLGVRFTLLEVAAALLVCVLAWEARGRLLEAAGQPRAPLLALLLYAAAHLLSALLAPQHQGLALKFAARMAAMAAMGCVVSAQPPEARRAGLLGLVTASILVAALAVAEGLGLRCLDGFLAAFREAPFNVGGVRRASAATEYPNLAAGFLLYGLMASAGLLSARRRVWTGAALAALLCLGLLFTYSRGALAASALGLVAIALARRSLAGTALACLAVLGCLTAVFAASGEAVRLRFGSEGMGGWYRARYEPAERELVMAPGERRACAVGVTNAGSKAWVLAEDFHLSYHWYDALRRSVRWDGERTALPRDLRPGDSVSLNATLQAPHTEGRFLLAWDMVHEHTTWFSEEGTPPAVVAVRVVRGAAPPPAAAEPLRLEEPPWRPSRWELWRLALVLWRERPLLGFGPDSYRRLYGERAGRSSWDTRVFANNTLLEALATTGILGASALAATLLSLLVVAWRTLQQAAPGSQAQAAAAALLALSVGVAAHGLVDYTLAFTGHYLLFGFLVGAVSAREPA